MKREEFPCVWVASSHRLLGNEHGKPQWYTVMDEVGTRTFLDLGLQPVTYPGVPPDRLAALLDTVDGVFLGGSATNVHPRHYGQDPASDGMDYDEARDALTLPLVRLAIERGVPLLGVCRGSHEINVALGGQLHQSLRSRPGSAVHWEDPEETLEEQYAPRHEVHLVPGGELQRMVGGEAFRVSSLHSQGARTLGPGLLAEAHAHDGLVEAFRWHQPGQFAWGFQFHPEWDWAVNPCYGRIMAAYVQACRERLGWRSAQAPRA